MPSSRIAVLCVHGIQGSPGQFNWVIPALPEHADVHRLLLPGHGADVRTFRKSGMAQWQACVDEALEGLSAQYENVYYIGHSMGCLLGIDACIRGKGSIAGLYLLACPLSLRPSLRYVKNSLCAAMGWKLNDPYIAAARAGNSVQAASPLAYLSCIRPYMDLLNKIGSVRRQLPALTVPVTAVHSDGDEIVGVASLRFFDGLPGARTHIVPGSGHYLYGEAARSIITGDILSALNALPYQK